VVCPPPRDGVHRILLPRLRCRRVGEAEGAKMPKQKPTAQKQKDCVCLACQGSGLVSKKEWDYFRRMKDCGEYVLALQKRRAAESGVSVADLAAAEKPLEPICEELGNPFLNLRPELSGARDFCPRTHPKTASITPGSSRGNPNRRDSMRRSRLAHRSRNLAPSSQ
jgi:hypothetical protein